MNRLSSSIRWLLLLIVGCSARPARAVFQASETVETNARLAEARGRYHEAALWHMAAIDMYQRISMPMCREMTRYEARYGDADRQAMMREHIQASLVGPLAICRAALIQDERRDSRGHRDAAAETALRDRIEDETLRWMVNYPDRFFRFGLYVEVQQDERHLLDEGKSDAAVELEAYSREVCARQYRDVLVRYLKDRAAVLRRRNDEIHANSFETMARLYERFAAQQVQDATTIRQNRSAVAALLSDPFSPDTGVKPMFRGFDALRFAFASRLVGSYYALKDSNPRARQEVVRYLVRTRSAEGLLMADRSDDPVVRNLASSSLAAIVCLQESTCIAALMKALPNASGDRLTHLNQLLAAYSGQQPDAGMVATIHNEDALRTFWQNWWAGSLHPGMRPVYFRDVSCKIRVDDEPGAVPPADAISARWELIFQTPREDVSLLYLRPDGDARAWLDGTQLDLRFDPVLNRRVARLELSKQQHVLRLEYVPTAGKVFDPQPVLQSLSMSGAPVQWYYHERTGTSQEPAPGMGLLALVSGDAPDTVFTAFVKVLSQRPLSALLCLFLIALIIGEIWHALDWHPRRLGHRRVELARVRC